MRDKVLSSVCKFAHDFSEIDGAYDDLGQVWHNGREACPFILTTGTVTRGSKCLLVRRSWKHCTKRALL